MFTYHKISIITPSYNQGNYIEETICSILDQNYQNLEYIIIDGGSTDNTIEIIKKYQKHLKYWISEKDSGQSSAINKGLQYCTGDIFNWINSDDYLEKDALFKVSQHFSENQNALMVSGYTRYFNHITNKTLMYHRSELFDTVEKTIVEQRINQQGSFYKTSVVKNLSGLNNALHFVMDLELWFRYLVNYGINNIILTDDLIAHFRIHDESKTSSFEDRFRLEEHFVLNSLLQQMSLPEFFTSDHNPNIPTKQVNWGKLNLDSSKFIYELCKKHFYGAYSENNYSACRTCFKYLKFGKDIPYNRHTLRIFSKSFFNI